MAAGPDYYEVLGIPRDAPPMDVSRAYHRWVSEFRKETTPPDPRRESLLREAYEVLSDEARRAAHDAELAAQPLTVARPKKGAILAAAAGVGVVVVGAAAYFALGSSAPAGPKPRSAAQIQAMAGSISPLVAYDISGGSAPAGLAWVVADKAMIASCRGMPPGAQLMVNIGPRQVPARITMADEALGLCKIVTDGYVGEPLAVSGSSPAVGAKVYTAALGGKGEVGLHETTVARVLDEPGGKAVHPSVPAPPGGHGGPLLDAQGKVVAVAAMQSDGKVLHRVIPTGWLAENRPPVAEPRPYQGDGMSPPPAASGGANPRKATTEEQRRHEEAVKELMKAVE